MRRRAAAKPNPGRDKQQSSIFYAITTGDNLLIKQMADSGWELPMLQDSAGKTALHRAAQVGNVGAGESASSLCRSNSGSRCRN